MALLFANHRATVYATIETPDPTTNIVPVPTEAAGVTLSCQIEPVRNEVLIDSRTGREFLNAYRMRVEPEDIGVPVYNARVVWEETGDQFRVSRKALRHAGGGELEDLDYGVCEMEQLEVLPVEEEE